MRRIIDGFWMGCGIAIAFYLIQAAWFVVKFIFALFLSGLGSGMGA